MVAGVDPAVGLFTSVIMPLVIALTGGRPAMITATAGSVALVLRCGSRLDGPSLDRLDHLSGRV